MFWNHLDISFPLSTGILFQIQIGFEVAYFDKSTVQVVNFEPVFLSFSLSQWQSFSAIMSVLSETPFISWYQANYSNILHYSNIRIMISKKRILFVIRIRPIFIIRCNTDMLVIVFMVHPVRFFSVSEFYVDQYMSLPRLPKDTRCFK